MKTIRDAEQRAEKACISAINAFTDEYPDILANDIENLYGGPKKFETDGINCQEAEDFAVEIWNEAIAAVIKMVRGK